MCHASCDYEYVRVPLFQAKCCAHKLTLEKQNGQFHVVKKDHVLLLVRDIHAIAFTNDTVPVRTKLFVHHLLDVAGCHLEILCSDVLVDLHRDDFNCLCPC